jgi:DNA-binding LytR/AlgR family response regulator
MNKKIINLITLLNEELGIFLSISFGVFLFVLFFEPFPLSIFDFNNRLLLVAGLGLIVFLFLFLIRIILPWILQNHQQRNIGTLLHTFVSGFIILILSAVAFAFYLHFVALVSISFYIMAKVILICIAPPVTIGLSDKIKDLRHQNESLIIEKKLIQKQIEKYEEDSLNKSIDFVSENISENLTLLVSEVVFIKSADNYVEIVFREGEDFKKKLIRNTLKNVEQQIRQYSNFIRCHRVCIVNIHYIEMLNKSFGNHFLTIKGYHEQLPVSRQYLMKLKEAL